MKREIMPVDCYSQFCPVSKACQLIEPRWTLQILCEMWLGSTRFNDIKRGVPGMSPTLLSRRLKDMERQGLIERSEGRTAKDVHYSTTSFANELQPIVFELGKWAHRNVDTEVTLDNLDAKLLMWNMRRKVDSAALPAKRQSVVQFIYPELPPDEQNYWLIAKPGIAVDLCLIDPGHDVNLYITADLRAMASAWIGHTSLRSEIANENIKLIGDRVLANSIEEWMVRSAYAA
jgi:DNA-binding HxlR family transcriptional regulator